MNLEFSAIIKFLRSFTCTSKRFFTSKNTATSPGAQKTFCVFPDLSPSRRNSWHTAAQVVRENYTETRIRYNNYIVLIQTLESRWIFQAQTELLLLQVQTE